MEDIIIFSRVVPPKIPENIVKRQQLNELLLGNIDKPLITVCSPAGYGKTTLILDFLEDSKLKYGWLHIQDDINNIYSFFSYLVHSLNRENPNFGKATLEIIESARKRYQISKHLNQIINLLTSTFINEFVKSFSEEVIIVLDELERIEYANWLDEALVKLISNIPHNLHFIITTRQLPDIKIPTLTAKRKILKIETSDLVLNKEEIKRLLKNYFEIEFADEEIQSLSKSMGGWITGIHLLLQAYGKDFPKYKSEGNILPEEIFFYFAEDIYRELDRTTKEFLLNTTLLEDFTQTDCDELLGIKKSIEIINNLIKKNIFIVSTSSPDKETSYNYHILFKKFLTSKLENEKTEEEILALYNSIQKYYRKKEDVDKAIKYSLLAKNYSEAMDLITGAFDKRFEEGKFDSVWTWFQLIPDDIFEQNPVLLYYKGLMTKFYAGDLEGAIPFFNEAIKKSNVLKNNDLALKCKISLARIYLSLGETRKAMNDIKKILKQNPSGENEPGLLYLMAYGYYVSADYDKSLKFLDQALSITETTTPTKELNDIYNLLGHINLIKGEFIKSISHYENILLTDFNLIDKFETLCNLVLLNSQSGNFEKAENYLKKAREVAEITPIPIMQIAFSLAEQAYHFEKGNYKENIRILTELNTLARKLNHKYYTYLSYRLIADTYYYLKNYAGAEEYYDLAFKFINDDSELEKTEFAQMKALLTKETNFREEIEDVLKNVLNFYIENGFVYNEIQAAFHLADFYLKAGKNSQAKQYLDEAVKFAFEKEYFSFLKRELIYSPKLFDFCYANNIEKKLIKELKESVVDTLRSDAAPGKAGSITEDHDAFTDLKMVSFGGLSFYKRSELIDDKLWQKKKRKLILAYLLLSPGMELTKDQIVDIFYPDTPAESVENIFYQSVSRIRKILTLSTSSQTNGKGADGSHSMVIYKDKVLKLNKDFLYYSDVHEFENLCRKAGVSGAKTDVKTELYKNALTLYTGNFMEGYYDNWVEEKRQALSNMFFTAGKNLLDLLSKQNRNDEVISYAGLILNADKLNETAYEALIKSLINTDNRKTAEKIFKDMVRNFKKETDEEPDGELMKRINLLLTEKTA